MNPKARILVLLKENDENTITNLFEIAFNQFKFLDIVVLTQVKHEVSKICAYNPFQIEEDKLFCKFLNKTNVDLNLIEIATYMESRYNNFHRYPLKIYMQEVPLISEKVLNENGKISHFKYVDGEVVQIFIKKFNFTPIYLTNAANKSGFQLPNGTIINAIRVMEHEYADLAGNHYITLERNTTNTVYLRSLVISKYYFVILSPETKKSVLMAMAASVDFPTKFLVSTILLILPLLFYVMLKQDLRRSNTGKITFHQTFFDFLSVIFNANAKAFSSSTSIRIFLAVVYFYGLLQHTFIQSTIIKNFNTNIHFGQIKKLNQLVDQNYNIFLLNQTKLIFRNFGGNKFADKLREVSNRVDNRTSEFPIGKKDAVFYGKMKANFFITTHYDNATKESLYTIVPEQLEFSESFMVPRKSPYQLHFNEIIQRIIDAGISHHEINLGKFGITIQMIRRAKRGDIPNKGNKPIKLSDISITIFLYLSFNALAILTFLLELIAFRLGRKVRGSNFR